MKQTFLQSICFIHCAVSIVCLEYAGVGNFNTEKSLIVYTFCFCYGISHGIAVATTFSLLRCFVFGFQIQVIILYLIYYNLFALFFGWLGAHLTGKNALPETAIVVAFAVVFTAMFMFLPNRKNKFMQSLPGALLSSIGWLVFSDLFSLYVENFSGYANVFGSVYAVALSMLWLYFCISIVFYGGALNQYLISKKQ